MMLIGSLSACSVDYDDMAEQRLSWARQAKGPIKIIAIGTDTRTNFIGYFTRRRRDQSKQRKTIR